MYLKLSFESAARYSRRGFFYFRIRFGRPAGALSFQGL
jgi:hypothetical protein